MKKKISLISVILIVVTLLSGFTFSEVQIRQNKLHNIANIARELGLPENSPIIKEASRLWWETNNNIEENENDNSNINEEDLKIIANVVYHESKYCTDEHQQLVAMVILNRKNSNKFPNTIKEVICAKNQYNPSYVLNLPDENNCNEEMKRCFKNARMAMNGEVICPANVLYQSQYSGLGCGHYKTFYVNTGYYTSTTYFAYG